MLETVRSSNSTAYTTCLSLKIHSWNILFKVKFDNPQKFLSSKISHPMVATICEKDLAMRSPDS